MGFLSRVILIPEWGWSWREKRPSSYVNGLRYAGGFVAVDGGAFFGDQSVDLAVREASGLGQASHRVTDPGRPGVFHQPLEQLAVGDAVPVVVHAVFPPAIPVRGWG
jgi:hypothetical protein